MKIKNLSDQELLSRTSELAARERELLTEILRHLREVERRRLFCELGYRSMFEYAVKELSYSEDQAWRRISAMRLLKELPQIEEKIAQGELTLSTVGVAANLFRAEKKLGVAVSSDRKVEVLAAMSGKSRREAEVIAQSFTPVTLKRDEVSPSLEAKIAKIKGLLAHSHPQISNAELFEKLCDDFLERHEMKISNHPPAPPRNTASGEARAPK
jgi:hypothetical protein